MKLKIKNFLLSIEYEGFMFSRDYDFTSKDEVNAFIEGIKTQYYTNCPKKYLEIFQTTPYHFFEYMTSEKTNFECEAFMYGMQEGRGIYGFNIKRG